MSAEFNWWLLIVGVVAGAALTWLVVADSSRREREVTERELPAEASWIARSLGHPPVDADTAERVLRAHRRYLGFPPPDVLVAPEQLEALQQDRVATTEPEPIAADAGPILAPARPADPAAPTAPERPDRQGGERGAPTR
jgi:hypothetical protein